MLAIVSLNDVIDLFFFRWIEVYCFLLCGFGRVSVQWFSPVQIQEQSLERSWGLKTMVLAADHRYAWADQFRLVGIHVPPSRWMDASQGRCSRGLSVAMKLIFFFQIIFLGYSLVKVFGIIDENCARSWYTYEDDEPNDRNQAKEIEHPGPVIRVQNQSGYQCSSDRSNLELHKKSNHKTLIIRLYRLACVHCAQLPHIIYTPKREALQRKWQSRK